MNRIKYIRVIYLMPLLALMFWPVSINCQQCGDRVAVESYASRIASGFEDNFFCGFSCAHEWLEEHPIYRNEDGDIIGRY